LSTYATKEDAVILLKEGGTQTEEEEAVEVLLKEIEFRILGFRVYPCFLLERNGILEAALHQS